MCPYRQEKGRRKPPHKSSYHGKSYLSLFFTILPSHPQPMIPPSLPHMFLPSHPHMFPLTSHSHVFLISQNNNFLGVLTWSLSLRLISSLLFPNGWKNSATFTQINSCQINIELTTFTPSQLALCYVINCQDRMVMSGSYNCGCLNQRCFGAMFVLEIRRW